MMRNFILRDAETGEENGIFTGYQPRQAALKAANRCSGTVDAPIEIRLRERGTRKVHIFTAWRSLVKAPETRPSWLPEEIYKPFVKKVGILKL